MVNGKIFGLFLIGSVAASMAGSVNAHIATMYYDSFGGFIENSQSTASGGADGVTFRGFRDLHDDNNLVIGDGNDSWEQVSWGTATGAAGPFGGQSGASLGRHDDEIVLTESGILVSFADLIHHNEPITTGGGNLTNVDISWNLHLYANATDAANDTNIVFDWHQHFNMDFWETVNSGTCPNTAPVGTEVGVPVNPANEFISDGNNLSTCDDTFAFHPISPQSSFFTYQGEQYEVVVSGFYENGTLTDSFWSAEALENMGYVRFEIKEAGSTAIATPTLGEWGLIILILAMAGVAMVYSRKQFGGTLNT
jgi:hypothetical protein